MCCIEGASQVRDCKVVIDMKKLKFLISSCMEGHPYQTQHAGTAEQVAQRLGVDLQVQYANNDAITQSEQLLKAIQSPKESRPDGIICAPVGTTLMRVARCAAESGIAWALVNRDGDYITELRRAYKVPVFSVTVDQNEIGRIQGRQFSAILPEGGLVLYLIGPSGSIGDQRLTAMQSAKSANIQVRTLTGDWTEEGGYKAVSRWLHLRTSHETPATLVACENDDMAIGARREFEDQTSREHRARWMSLPYIGCDCCPGAGLEWVRTRTLAASLVNPPTRGRALVSTVRAIRTPSTTPECTTVDPVSYPAVEKLAKVLTHTGAA